MNRHVLEFAAKKYGGSFSADYYSRYIELWAAWWRGYHKPFHRFRMNNGIKVIERDIYSLGMAKKVCEDWASVLLNEKTHVKISDERASEFIQGKRETGGVFKNCHFWVNANRLIEKAFYSGTGAAVIRLKKAKNRDGQVEVHNSTQLCLEFVSAEYILPISCQGGVITEAAFCSEHLVRGSNYVICQVHTLESDGYVIRNHCFCTDNGGFREAPLFDDITAEFHTQEFYPWFSIISPNIENNIPCSGGLGVSILHGAIDILKGVDLAYNNLVKDFELGGKKVFMQKSLIETTEDGVAVAPDDVGQQLFHYLPENLIPDSGAPLIQEHNPLLRVTENKDGVQAQLDYLSFKCGLGNKHYQFNSGAVVTATQYTGDKQDLIQNAHKHYVSVERFLISLVRSLIHIGNRYFSLGADENTDIEIIFDKSVIIDEAAERAQDIQDVRDGIMPKWQYRSKWYGEDEQSARKIISEIEGGSEDEALMDFEDGEA
ncbi:MAG: hypothetical protein IJ446_09005 [Oscillospiraceae bacterium]|nr:hypothetical protein [Oscillospiraceae bacterium]